MLIAYVGNALSVLAPLPNRATPFISSLLMSLLAFFFPACFSAFTFTITANIIVNVHSHHQHFGYYQHRYHAQYRTNTMCSTNTTATRIGLTNSRQQSAPARKHRTTLFSKHTVAIYVRVDSHELSITITIISFLIISYHTNFLR